MDIRTWRITEGLTQGELGDLLEVKKSYISQIENGHKSPSPKMAKRIQIITSGKISAAELLGLKASSVHETPADFDRSVSIEIDSKIAKDAAAQGIDVASVARRAIEEDLNAARLRSWVTENRTAFDAHAKDIEENGLWSDGFRLI